MNWVGNIALRWKLMAAFGLVIVIVFILNTTSYQTMLANRTAQRAVEASQTAQRQAAEAQTALVDMETGYRGFLITGRDTFLEPYTRSEQTYRARLQELRDDALNDEDRARWDKIGVMAESWQSEFVRPGIALRRTLPVGAPPSQQLTDLVSAADGKVRFDEMRVVFNEADRAETERLAARTATARAANDSLTGTLLRGLIMVIIVGVVTAFLTTIDINRAVARLASAAQQIADGNLSVRVGLKRRDEIGQAAAAFDTMADRLQASIARLETSQAELMRQHTELERSNRELQDFASVASHDLQEPLRKVQAFGDRLNRRHGDALAEEGRDYLNRMMSAASRMQILIEDLLAFSRVSSRAQPFTVQDLNVVASQVLSDLEVRVQQLDATVTVNTLPTLEADGLQMRQLFQNLIGNGLKFHKPGVPPVVTIDGGVHGDEVSIVVADNGIGFDEKYLDRIFSIFQRLHGREEYEGTGIGLAVCRKIVERHGGTITARSAPGEGATFVVTLPVTQSLVLQTERQLEEVA